jgi:hypothetical protein
MNSKILAAGVAAFYIGCFLLLVGATAVKAEETVVDMRNFLEGDLVVDGFILNNKTRLSVHAIGAELEHSDDLYAGAWILDAATREPVWIMNEEDTRRYEHSDYMREYDDEIVLPAGRYEAYYYAGQPFYFDGYNIQIDDLGEAIELLSQVFEKKNERRFSRNEDIDELMFQIKAPEGSFEKYNPVAEINENTIVDFSQPEDDFYEKKGFTLKKDMPLHIIAIGEYSTGDRVFVDYGWIYNADTREKVWQMDKWNTAWAGGGRKNREFNDDITLPKGNYVACYATDDSHSFGEWNVLPPYDPLHYGLIIYPKDTNDLKYVEDFTDNYSEPVIIQMTKVRNGEYRHEGFTLDKETSLHIVCLGEYGYNDEFVDYGWIENVDNNEIVWEMTEDNTEHAGGASKNRKFDGIITLPPGNYMANYVTDDSHAYRRWNSAAPLDQKMWGLTIYGVGKDFDPSSVKTFEEPPPNSNVLVSMTGLGDDEEVEESFTLDKSQKIRIYALGEGRDGEMFDFGWIEDAKSDDIIWEMTYRKTRHGGGDKKNRLVDTHIFLDKGTYNVYFVTDGSHSFPEFNASRPDNPQKWGITITRE